jgi:hypothetical protein
LPGSLGFQVLVVFGAGEVGPLPAVGGDPAVQTLGQDGNHVRTSCFQRQLSNNWPEWS